MLLWNRKQVFISHVAGESWQYSKSSLEFHERLFTVAEMIESDPMLKSQWNERVRKDKAIAVGFVDFRPPMLWHIGGLLLFCYVCRLPRCALWISGAR